MNTGNATLFNGKVWVREAFVPVDRPMVVWNYLPYSDTIVMGPGDREDIPIGSFALNESQRERLFNGQGAVMLAMRVDFPDAGKRMHHRFYCARWYFKNGTQPMAGVSCATPPQN